MSIMENFNYCHDPDIIEAAKRLGVKDRHVINKALSIGEAGAYRSTDVSEDFLSWSRSILKKNKANQPKQRLSRSEKKRIVERHNQKVA